MKKVNKYINILIIELCCPNCYFKNIHSGHKIYEISDEESLKKENITIESSTKEFSEIVENIIKLKNKIENEINNINNLYETTINDLTKSFEEKYEKLKKEENDIREKLQNEVTKVKEKLENTLSLINYQINISEKLNKGIKKFENEEKNLIKTLSYVSKINKNQKEMKLILKESLRSIKFSYKKEENNIKYEDITFNSSKNVKLKMIEKGTCEVNIGSWGRILFDIITDKVYFAFYCNNKVNIYENYEKFKSKNIYKTITLSKKISGSYPVMHKGFFYFFEYNSNCNNNNLIKYDLNQNKIIDSRIILPDAVLGNTQNSWGGCNDIILISDNVSLYAVYSSSNNNKRISIGKIDDNNLTIIKIWNIESLEKKKCGPIFMINNTLYHIKTYDRENDAVIYSYDLLEGKNNNNINIPFENKGKYDHSLTYYPHLKCLMTENNNNIYKYNVVLDSEI